MLSKSQVKYLHSLQLGKYRELNNVFPAEGVKLVGELLDSTFSIQSIYATRTWIDSQPRLKLEPIQVVEVTREELGKISSLATPNEVVAVVAIPQRQEILPGPEERLVLLLDRLQDPGNLGTIIRTADWFGVNHIICSEDTVDAYNPKVVQATMGSICRVSVRYDDLKLVMQEFRLAGRKIYGAMAGGKSVYGEELASPAALLIGNESQGIRPGYHPDIDLKIGIPRMSKAVESLNAAVAASILCSEFARRHAP